MKAAIQALGYDKDTLEVEIIQMVQLYQNGEKMKMSKRTGKAVTLRELMEEVGVDAMRYFFAMRSGDSHLDFDMDLAVSKSNETQYTMHNTLTLAYAASFAKVKN